MLFYQGFIKTVVTCRHGRMGREHRILGDLPKCIIERHSVVVHPATNDFQGTKRAVPFVQMVGAWSNSESS